MTYDILIADDHPLFRSALHQALSIGLGPEARLVEAESIAQLESRLGEKADWDLVLLDLNMPFLQRLLSSNNRTTQLALFSTSLLSISTPFSTMFISLLVSGSNKNDRRPLGSMEPGNWNIGKILTEEELLFSFGCADEARIRLME